MISLPDIVRDWPAIVSAIGGLGAGGIAARWLDHRLAKRKQTDEVALALVDRLMGQIARAEAESRIERASCEARVAALREELSSVAASFDSLILALRYAPPEHIPLIAQDVIARRSGVPRATAAPIVEPVAPL